RAATTVTPGMWKSQWRGFSMTRSRSMLGPSSRWLDQEQVGVVGDDAEQDRGDEPARRHHVVRPRESRVRRQRIRDVDAPGLLVVVVEHHEVARRLAGDVVVVA